MKKMIAAIIAFTALAACLSAGAYANGLEAYNDYMNPDGSYSYYFEQGITVTMPEEWYLGTIVKAYDNRAVFCHKGSYQKWAETGIENGGILFSIGYSVNTSFKDLDEMTYIGFDENEMLNYYAVKPTDYQAYSDDPEIKAEYDRLFSTADDVISGIRILSAGAAASCEGTAPERTPSSDIFSIVGNDLFSFECATGWETRQADNGIIASKGGDGEVFPVPNIMIFPVDVEGTAEEKAEKLKTAYMDTYKNRLANEPEIITFETDETRRSLTGVRAVVSSEDGMETVTCCDLLEELNGQFFIYSCAYVSATYEEDAYEDETTFFEYLHAIETMECAVSCVAES